MLCSDAKQFCDSSTGSLSLSRCQLFESGFPPEILHLNDPSCKGISENGRVLFHFDNEGHVCGTTLMVMHSSLSFPHQCHYWLCILIQNYLAWGWYLLMSSQSNGTHFIYQNAIHSNLPAGVITREKWMNIAFSCAYPLIQNLSMPKDIQAERR